MQYFQILDKLEEYSPYKDTGAAKQSALEFLQKEKEALKAFVNKYVKDFGEADFLFLAKMFLLSKNKVFNMPAYMKQQSKIATDYVEFKYGKDIKQSDKRDAVNKWIERNADTYRKFTIFWQQKFLEELARKIKPMVKEALEEK